MTGKKLLLTPGPTPIPEEIQEEMAKPIIHHRTPQYREIFAEANKGLKNIFKTSADILTFTSSGTGAMEASVVNTLSKGDKAIVVRGGKFGERFAELCEAYGVGVIAIDMKWGTGPDPKVIEKTLSENKDVKAVFVNLCETSTATVYDIESIGRIVKDTPAILVVDVISGLGSDEFKMDEWHVDITVGGSQKGLMIPPGLAFCAISKKAWDLVSKSTLPKYYLDFKKYKKSVEKDDVPFTPAITLEIGLRKAIAIIEKEGVDNSIKRHTDDAEYLRSELKKMGLEIFSKSPSNAVTAAMVPQGIDGGALIKALKQKGITFAGGQAELKGKIFRIASMGAITRKDLDRGLSALKDVLKELEVKK